LRLGLPVSPAGVVDLVFLDNTRADRRQRGLVEIVRDVDRVDPLLELGDVLLVGANSLRNAFRVLC
jgi:hypothetical protein